MAKVIYADADLRNADWLKVRSKTKEAFDAVCLIADMAVRRHERNAQAVAWFRWVLADLIKFEVEDTRTLIWAARWRNMQPINTPKPKTSVQYDCWGKRKVRTFSDPYEARRFYIMKLKEGKNPKVVSDEKENGGRESSEGSS